MCFCSQSGSEPYHCVTLECLLMQCSLCISSRHTNTLQNSEISQTDFPLLSGKVPGKWEDSLKAAKSNNNGEIHMHIILKLLFIHNANMPAVNELKVCSHLPKFSSESSHSKWELCVRVKSLPLSTFDSPNLKG